MKKLALIGLAAFSLSNLHAADAQPDAAPPAPATPEAAKPLPPLESTPDAQGGGKKFVRPHLRKPRPAPGDKAKPDFAKGEKPRGKGHEPGDRAEGFARALELTPDQIKQAKVIMQKTKPKLEAVRTAGHAKAKAILDEAMAELRPILTPEQQTILDDMQKLRADREALSGAGRKAGKLGKPQKVPKEKAVE